MRQLEVGMGFAMDPVRQSLKKFMTIGRLTTS
jgi:hypothetical protein